MNAERTGLDRLLRDPPHALRGARVALLVNHAAVDARGRHAAHVLADAAGCTVATLLGPEHGVWGTHQDMEPVEDAGARPLDPILRLPTRSLYGHDASSLKPDPAALAGVDAVVYDVPDIGARYYTYAATLALVMETAAELGLPVWVLDRPNPIGPRREGPLLRPGFESFCGLVPGLPIRHGLSVGALARWYGARRAPGCELHVVTGRDADAGVDPRAWVPTSPNMPTLDTAVVYPGMCLLEGTTLSEGRGTTTPFLSFGAPGMDAVGVVDRLRARDLPGVQPLVVRFRPAFQKHAGRLCDGVYLRVTDPAAVDAVALGVLVLDAVRHASPDALGWRADAYEFVDDVPAIDLLWGSADLRRTIDAGGDPAALLVAAQAEADAFDPEAPA